MIVLDSGFLPEMKNEFENALEPLPEYLEEGNNLSEFDEQFIKILTYFMKRTSFAPKIIWTSLKNLPKVCKR